MNIAHDDWKDASGTFVQDTQGNLWRIIGFIDRPAVILDPIKMDGREDARQRETVIMDTEHSRRFARLKLEAQS